MKAFSVASWNIKHFKGKAARVDRVVEFLKAQDPDLFTLYEVTGAEVFVELSSRFPQYTFQITEGPQMQEILVGVKSTITAFITQKLEFKAGSTYMRPGSLVTVTIDEVNYTLLFLHLASGDEPRNMGLRDEMLYRATKFRKKLDSLAGGKGQARYIFCGDLNVMGLEYPYDRNISAKLELKRTDSRASRYWGMRRLEKTHPFTWKADEGSDLVDSDLDHVYASKNLKFKKFTDKDGNQKDVDVRGWVNLDGDAVYQWRDEYSDHSLLYFEVQKPD